MHPDTAKRRIFVQIASYRDPECHATVRDLFEKAKHPERVNVGICWQYDPEADKECFVQDYPREEQVRVVQYHIRDAQGAGWARMEAQSLWKGEEYTLQIQAHMRFEKHWDETLIELLHALPTEKAVLTAWLPGYVPPDKKQPKDGMLPLAVVNRLGGEGDAQIVHYIKRMVPEKDLRGKILPAPSWIGNFMFTRSETLADVPFDPHIYFWGEEINYSARLFTHGYDIFHLDRRVLYHYWDRDGVKDEAIYRDHGDKRNRLSLERNLHLLGLKQAADAGALRDIGKYTLGKARTMDEYWRFAGFDPRRGRITRKARDGAWALDDVPAPRAVDTAVRPRIFVAIASHRDSECKWTVKDLFDKARYPDRINVGICLQNNPRDKDMDAPTDRPQQVRITRVNAHDSKGANWARAEAVKLMDGEDYVLQIDAHMRFEKHWDEMLLEMLSRCPAEKPVLSTYLPNYDPPDKREYPGDLLIRIKARALGERHEAQLVHITGHYVARGDERATLYPSPFFIANFMFARASTLREVPIDPHFFFYGDEISYAARLWTHGYDIFQPDRIVMFHYWVRLETLPQQHYRDTKTPAAKRSYKRVKHLLGIQQTHDKAALEEIEKYGLGDERSLDDLWAFAGIDWADQAITADAQEGRWNMAARHAGMKKKAKKAAAHAAKLPRIFVQIASYRDPDLQWTVKDMFEKAKHPDRIFAGICFQIVREEDADCLKVPYPRPDQVRVHEADAMESKGVCWARAITQGLWNGEEYTLQIDSHMRFEQDWDEILLAMWKDCKDEKAVLTCYPPGFTPPRSLEDRWIFGMSAKEFNEFGIFTMKGAPAFTNPEFPAHPVPGAFLGAGMIFAPAAIIKDVPYDPHLYFFGEEITMAVRLWTHGYNFFHPNRLAIYHDWERAKRKTHFTDHGDWKDRDQRSIARVQHLLGTRASSDPEVTKDIGQYGFGSERTLAEYQAYSGVDFASKHISEKALNGVYERYAGKKKTNGAFAIKKNGKDSRIYVQIASYRDPECQWTVKDLFEKAKNPDRLSVGICWQYDPDKDADCFEVTTRPDQVRVIPVDWREAEGVCWARNQTQQLWDGEEYTLQIDAHMRFVPGWDDLMIDELAACESDKPLLTCSPAAYTPPNKLQPNPRPAVRRVMPFFPDGNLRGRGESLDRVPETPLNGAFVAAGFVFSRAEIIPEVPYDPYLYFDQEEISYAARLYTHGWDVFSSRKPLLYHYYNDKPTGSVRPLHWKDLREEDASRSAFFRERGLKRFNHLTGHTISSDPKIMENLESYGFGRARTLAQFEEYTGIDFKRKIASEKALRCLFIKDLYKYRDRPIHVPELDGKPGQPKANGAGAVPAAKAISAPSEKGSVTIPLSRMLEVGDFIPFFEAGDTSGKFRGIELHGGRHTMLVFLPVAHPEYAASFFRSLTQEIAKGPRMDFWQVFILDDTVDNLKAFKEKLKLPQVLSADPGGAIAQAFGVYANAKTQPAGYLLNQNLKIVHRYLNLPPQQLAANLIGQCRIEIENYKRKLGEPRIISEMAPALIVPNAFSPEFCAKCIDAFNKGPTFDGTVGAEDKTAYRPETKARRDYIVHGQLLREIDDKLSRSLFPEIKKVFGFDVMHREFYKIGKYSAEKGGFFKQHRDNFDIPLGYRRLAMTLQLNDDYEGGGLHFPEYDNHTYRPAKGSAIVFSGSTLHEAWPVTKGDRFVVVGFMHGKEEEAFRQHYVTSKGQPSKAKEYAPTLRQYPGLKFSRAFFTDWQQKNVHFDAEANSAIVQNQSGTTMTPAKPNVMINTTGKHQPKKVWESASGVIYDDFLPEETYRKLADWALTTDYERINTKGKIARAWHVHDGFPLRSMLNLFYYPEGAPEKPAADYVYPTKTPFDAFVPPMLEIQSDVANVIEPWAHFTATAWMYPHGTGLSFHDDGAGVYSGAYVYFLNPVWRPHWGGLLLLMEDAANKAISQHAGTFDPMDFYKRKWLHAHNLDEVLMEQGFAKCVFPKRNRMVFIHNKTYHMVTRVNEQSGDNLRMSIAGFFNKKK